ncbi:protein kinase domain-containing protein [Paraliomyxa miuraensis]|uniref:protein kinase domain-containing protein n=1 Tax=Paraliomyxa miuraensis TaxID=376150 RepID=UPI00225A3C6A|nr:tetratricopeptide repeat protein [Paraliomyxa miuraensis]MCX4245759.1 tetratricopeptide repeat protein [Paraliomyxa miuraensis]
MREVGEHGPDVEGDGGEPSRDPAMVAAPLVSTLGHAVARQRIRAMLLGEQAEPVRVDRFALRRELGQGGMGTVWLAHDAQLDREVALKFLRRSTEGDRAEQRLLEEAKSLAKLSHPNVVPVYDAGRHEGRVWVAMEFVPGRTLRAWVEGERPSARQRLEAWIEAGRGLAAVHAAGLVHRDVKPDNVLRGDDGRVRLIDFGLVRRAEVGVGEEGMQTLPGSGSGAASGVDGDRPAAEPRTRTGGFVGTPAYAAPEQRTAAMADARSDQFAYCMSVWEALCGVRPGRERLPERKGGLVPLPSRARMPGRVQRALSRGLSRDPALRFSSMDALLGALAPRRGRWLAAAVAGTGALGVTLGLLAAPSEAVAEPCANAGRAIDERWTDEHRGVVAAHDEELATLVDDWSMRWRDAARRACEEVHVEQLRPEATLGPRRACLQERLDELDVLLAVERGGTRERLPVEWLGVLDEPGRCLSPALLEADAGEPPPELGDEVSRIRRELLVARWGMDDPNLERRRERVAVLYEASRGLGFEPLVGHAAHMCGQLAASAGDVVGARRCLGEALDVGQRHDPALVIDAWMGLQELAIDQQLDAELAQWLGERTEPWLNRLPEDRQRRAGAVLLQGRMHLLRDELAQAESALRDAVERYEALGPSTRWVQAAAMRQLAVTVQAQGRSEQAVQLHQQARMIETREEGAQIETRVGEGILAEGVALQGAGKLSEAEDAMRRALDRLMIEYGPGSVGVANAHVALAGLHDARGELDRMRERAEAADGILADIDPRHPDRLYSLAALGTVAYREKRFSEAADVYERALSIAEQRLPPRSQELAWNRINLAEALLEIGQDQRADGLLRRALPVLESELGTDHPELAIPLKALGAVTLTQGDGEQSLRWLGRALALFESTPGSVVEQAETHWLLAKALRAVGDLDAALLHARRAETDFSALGPAWAQRTMEIGRWLEQ